MVCGTTSDHAPIRHLSAVRRDWRLAKDFEHLDETLVTFVILALIQLAFGQLNRT
jgi:hypothetical protein